MTWQAAFGPVLAAVALAACAGVGREMPIARPVDARQGATATYRCADGGRVEALYRGRERLRLFLPGSDARDLVAVRAASGARYAADGLAFWEKGGTARLIRPGADAVVCRKTGNRAAWAQAAAEGARFRALGQEPGWIVVVGPEHIRVELDYGTRVLRLPKTEPETRGAATVWTFRSDAHSLRLIAREEACRDSMSGFLLPEIVRLTIDGRTLDGCGRWLTTDG